jgi:glucose-6-phosphate isomerase
MFTINYSGILSEIIGEKDGLTKRELEYFSEQFKDSFTGFVRERSSLGFCQVINDSKTRNDVNEYCEQAKWAKNIAVLGIGGSSLGADAILNIIPHAKQARKVYIFDNIDPFSLKETINTIDFKRTLFFVISKSGETVETLSQFLFCYKKIKDLKLNPQKHIVFITDPAKGFLRELSNRDKFRAFEVPQNVGGRFSVLSAVGILPAKFMGVDIKALHEGARSIDKNSMKNVFNFSLFMYMLNSRRNKKNVVLMPYCDRLHQFALWFSQLWAESLGKKTGVNNEILRTGQTPIVARGVTDQHSQLQLYLEGPKDKVIILFKVKDKTGIKIPAVFKNSPSVNYLNNKSFDELFQAEYIGTYGSLLKEKIPAILIELDKLDFKTIGGLFHFFELCTAFSGKLYGVNPFDQPGVETGKKIAFSYLGKEGYGESDFKKISKKLKHELSCD